MRCFLVCLFVLLPSISCLTPDEKTTKWILDYFKTKGEEIIPSVEESESNLNPTAVQTAPNLNPAAVQTAPNLNPTAVQTPPHLNPTAGQIAPNLNPNNGHKRPNLNPSGGQQGHTSRPNGGHRGPNLNPSQARGNSCITKDGTVGECVSYYICDHNNTLIDDGADIIDIRHNSRCPHYLLVCCEIHNIGSEEKDSEETVSSEAPTPPKKNPSPSEQPLMSSEDKNQWKIEALSQDNENLLSTHRGDITYTKPTTCGWSNIDISPFQPKQGGPVITKTRPVNITSSLYGEFPFMVAVLLNSDSSVWSPNDYIGGGALIHYRVVITAAHKVYKATKLKVRAGEHDTQTIREQFPYQERNVAKIKNHDDFFKPSVYYDIALLILEAPFSEAPHIGIACLSPSFPEKSDDCYSMGWGRQVNDLSAYAETLKKIPLPLVGANDCQALLRKTRLGPFFRLHQSLTCAGGESSIDTCMGDGGSPLVCSIASNGLNKRFVVIGLVAYGISCGTVGVPGVYVNVPFLYDWIETQMDIENIVEKNYKL